MYLFAQIAIFLTIYKSKVICSLKPGLCTFTATLSPFLIIPLITCHGYVLGQSIVNAEPTPIFTYLIGLLISEAIAIRLGVLILHRFLAHKKLMITLFQSLLAQDMVKLVMF